MTSFSHAYTTRKTPVFMNYGISLCLIFLLSAHLHLHAQQSPDREKAILIQYFSNNIDWPSGKVKGTFNICVLSQDSALFREMQILFENKKIKGKPVNLFLSDTLISMSTVNVVVIDKENSQNIQRFYTHKYKESTLIITDQSEEPLYVMINFTADSDSGFIQYEVNPYNLQDANLDYHPDLLTKGGQELDMSKLRFYTSGIISRDEEKFKRYEERVKKLEGRNFFTLLRIRTLQKQIDSLDDITAKKEALLRKLSSGIQEKELALVFQSKELTDQKDIEKSLKSRLKAYSRDIDASRSKLESINKQIQTKEAIIQSQEELISARDEAIVNRDRTINTQQKNLLQLLIFLSVIILVVLVLIWAYYTRKKMNARLESLVGKRTQELKNMQDYYQNLFDCSPVAIVELELNPLHSLMTEAGLENEYQLFENIGKQEKMQEILRHVSIPNLNDAAVRLFEAPDREYLRRNMEYIIGEEALPLLKKAFSIFRNQDHIFESQGLFLTFKKKPIELIFRWIRLPGFGSDQQRVLVTFTDVTTLKKFEAELRDHRDNLESLVKERSSRIVQLNEELISTNKALTFQKKQLEEAIQQLQSTQKQLIQAEKMVSLGMLSAGIAHEINNPINFISGGNQLLREQLSILLDYTSALQNRLDAVPETIRESLPGMETECNLDETKSAILEVLQMISEGINRTTEIINSLSLYSRGDEEIFTHFDIRKAVSQSLLLLRNKYKSHIEVIENYSEIPEIECLPAKVNQVFVNLISNSIDAIQTRGKITISVWFDDSSKTVITKVTDNGQGIQPEILERIFDPFFTTKEIGKGTGLGLYLVYQILQQHHVSMECRSVPDKGTEFTLYWPLNRQQSAPNVTTVNLQEIN